MNTIKKKRARKKFDIQQNRFLPFTFNKTVRNQPNYTNMQPRCPGNKGNRGNKQCKGSNTLTGCKTCTGCLYSFDVSGAIFNGAYPEYGTFVNINPSLDSNYNLCEWRYNGIVDNITNSGIPSHDIQITLNIENDTCIKIKDISGIYFQPPKGSNRGVIAGYYYLCIDNKLHIDPSHNIINLYQDKIITTAKRMGAPYRNPIAGWRKTLECCDNNCENNCSSNAPKQTIQTIYKDNYSGKKNDDSGCCSRDCNNNSISNSGIQGRTHRPIIRSGMQPKSSCCKPCVNDYSFDYRQYQHNKRCLSFERSQEKYIGNNKCKNENGKCLNRYNKGGCYCCMDCSDKPVNNKANTVTIYKPNNKKFSKQGAVTAGSRLERLKLDTLRASNSKCIKGQRCKEIPSKFEDSDKVYKYPNGPYFAGQPRFTGWMFNKYHHEVVNMNKYSQQPLGIPQLTAHPPGNTCIKECFPRTLNLGTNRSTAAGNRARAPGSKCGDCIVSQPLPPPPVLCKPIPDLFFHQLIMDYYESEEKKQEIIDEYCAIEDWDVSQSDRYVGRHLLQIRQEIFPECHSTRIYRIGM